MNDDLIPAIPPSDYSGSQSDWMLALISRGLLEDGGWHGDVELEPEVYAEILQECEE